MAFCLNVFLLEVYFRLMGELLFHQPAVENVLQHLNKLLSLVLRLLDLF